MLALQLVEFGAPLTPRTLPDPQPVGTEVVVDVAMCGLCHSDVHFHEGHVSLGGDQLVPVTMLGLQPPTALGHEIYGHIASFGPEAGLDQDDIGRPVVVYPWIGCGVCPACLAERDNECPTPRALGVQQPGGHGEKVLVREPKYLIDAKGLDGDYAGILACCGLTAYAALRKLERRDGWIGIIGAGGLGLMALAIEKGLSQSQVAVFDLDDAKLAVASAEYGADRVVNSRHEQSVADLREASGGLIGIIDFVGSQSTLEMGMGLLRNGGTYVDVGLFGATLQTPLALLASRQLSVRGSYTGTPAELRELVEHVRLGRIKAIPTRVESIETVNDGIADLRAGRVNGRLIHRHAG